MHGSSGSHVADVFATFLDARSGPSGAHRRSATGVGPAWQRQTLGAGRDRALADYRVELHEDVLGKIGACAVNRTVVAGLVSQ